MDEIEIDGWKLHLVFSAVHIIPKYEKCGRLHGHTYAINAKIYGKKNKDGIIVDFIELKNNLRKVIEELDHRILIPKNSKDVVIEKDKVRLIVNGKEYLFPLEDCVLLPLSSTTAENLAEYIINKLVEKTIFPSNVDFVEIRIDEGPGQGAKVSKRLK